MTNSEVSIELVVNGDPYIFYLDATDGSQGSMLNLVSSQNIGDTFSDGAMVERARGGYCENYALGGITLLDPQNNVAFTFPVTRLENQNANGWYPVGVAVGLNFDLAVTTAASLP
jgi:hypothetical protein